MKPEETAGVGKIPSGLFIIAARHGDRIDGFLGSFVQQVSMEPLVIALAVKPGRPVYDSIIAGSVFTINVVGEHDKSFLKLFWKGYDPSENPFDELPYRETENGGIELSQALASIDVRKTAHFHPGDHELVLAEVISSVVLKDEKPVVHLRRNGLSY